MAKDFGDFDLAFLHHVNDAEVSDPQPIERRTVVAPAVLYVGSWTRAERIRLEFFDVG